MQKYKPLVVISAFRLSEWLREKSGRDQLSYDKRPICFFFLLPVSINITFKLWFHHHHQLEPINLLLYITLHYHRDIVNVCRFRLLGSNCHKGIGGSNPWWKSGDNLSTLWSYVLLWIISISCLALKDNIVMKIACLKFHHHVLKGVRRCVKAKPLILRGPVTSR